MRPTIMLFREFGVDKKTCNKPQAINTQQKKTYNAPVLSVFGAVKTLTQSLSKGGKENNHGREGRGSDRAIKENIVRIGTHPLGIGLYLFDYKAGYPELSGYGRQMGVMADEVERVMPEAVSRHSSGYKQVNYRLLGLA